MKKIFNVPALRLLPIAASGVIATSFSVNPNEKNQEDSAPARSTLLAPSDHSK